MVDACKRLARFVKIRVISNVGTEKTNVKGTFAIVIDHTTKFQASAKLNVQRNCIKPRIIVISI